MGWVKDGHPEPINVYCPPTPFRTSKDRSVVPVVDATAVIVNQLGSLNSSRQIKSPTDIVDFNITRYRALGKCARLFVEGGAFDMSAEMFVVLQVDAVFWSGIESRRQLGSQKQCDLLLAEDLNKESITLWQDSYGKDSSIRESWDSTALQSYQGNRLEDRSSGTHLE